MNPGHFGPIPIQSGSFGPILGVSCFGPIGGAPVAQWVKRWPTNLADRVGSSLEVKSFQP